MGRAKIKMELIKKEKARITTLKKRKEGLIRKLHEFTTLCDVDACMIIYGGGKDSPAAEIWPENRPEHVARLVECMRSSKNVKSYGLREFLDERRRKIKEEVAKLRRRNLEAMYPTRPEVLHSATEPQLRELHSLLAARVHYVRSRLSIHRNNIPTTATTYNSITNYCPPLLEANPMNIPMNIPMNFPMDFPTAANNNQSMSNLQSVTTMLFSNEQFHSHQLFLQEPIIPPAPWFYAPPPPPPPPPQQYYMLPPPPPQLQYYDDFVNYLPTNLQDGFQFQP